MISRFSISPFLLTLPHDAALNPLLVTATLKDRVDENSGGVNAVRLKLSKWNDFLYFGYDMVSCGSHHGIEVPSRFSVHKIAPSIASPCFDESKFSTQPGHK